MSRFQDMRDGRHVHLWFDEGLGWVVVYRGMALDGIEALSNPIPRVRRLAKKAALRNPNHGLQQEGEIPIFPQRGSDKPG